MAEVRPPTAVVRHRSNSAALTRQATLLAAIAGAFVAT
jgi:hypothetical protein